MGKQERGALENYNIFLLSSLVWTFCFFFKSWLDVAWKMKDFARLLDYS